jgi:hypothetical protein
VPWTFDPDFAADADRAGGAIGDAGHQAGSAPGPAQAKT